MFCCCLEERECLRCCAWHTSGHVHQPPKPAKVGERRGSLSAGDTASLGTSPQKAPSKLLLPSVLWRGGLGTQWLFRLPGWKSLEYIPIHKRHVGHLWTTNITLATVEETSTPAFAVLVSDWDDVLKWRPQSALSTTMTCQQNSLGGSALRRRLWQQHGTTFKWNYHLLINKWWKLDGFFRSCYYNITTKLE